MKVRILIGYLILLFSISLAVGGQQMSTTDALQDDRILDLRSKTAVNSQRIDQIANQVADLSVTVNTSIGFMKGMGAIGICISVMQIASLILSRKEKRGTS